MSDMKYVIYEIEYAIINRNSSIYICIINLEIYKQLTAYSSS